MKKNKDSIAKGGGSLVLARVLGMAFSFLLFLFLARQSTVDAGVFRSVVTYIIIAEYLGMLGMFRWLTAEMAAENESSQWPIYLATLSVSVIASCILGLIYVTVAKSGIYSQSLSLGIMLAALATIPSGIFDCVQAAYVGIGKSNAMGKLNILENLVRSFVAIIMIKMGLSVIYIIGVFILMRWVVAIVGSYHLSKVLKASTWVPNQQLMKKVMINSPRFAVIIMAFMVVKNIAMVMLPAIKSDHEAAMFAVGYQLFDLILVAPSMLAVSASNVFVNKANKSLASLKRVSTQLISLTSILMFPLAAITAAFSLQFLNLLYGSEYTQAKWSLMWLMLAAMMMMIDQVLSQIMLAKRDYKSDMYSIVWGGLTAFIFTLGMGYLWAEVGASIALVLAILVTIIVRFKFLKGDFNLSLLLTCIWRPMLGSLIVFFVIYAMHEVKKLNDLLIHPLNWMPLVLIALLGYWLLIRFLGAISHAKIARMRRFLFQS